MNKILDKRFGNRGRGIWFYTFRLLVLVIVIFFLIRSMLIIDFSSDKAVLMTMLFSVFFVFYLLIGNIQILLEAPFVAQFIEYNENVVVRYYFGQKKMFMISDIKCYETFKLNKLMKFESLLSFSSENYKVYINDGGKIYISGDLINIDKFVHYLGSADIKKLD